MVDPAAEAPSVPQFFSTRLNHAAVQWFADAEHLDVLHIKGAAVDAALRPKQAVTAEDGSSVLQVLPRLSSDADVLVRPEHVDRLLESLLSNGWRLLTDFSTGSAFHHAATLWHPNMGCLDIHRFFPGISLEASEAFDLLWEGRESIQIAHRPCQVPSVTAQRVILLLHAARGGRERDIEWCWERADEEDRAEARELVDMLGAHVAFAAAIGGLEEYVDAPDHDLWALYAARRESDRWAEWAARIRAATTWQDKLRELRGMMQVNRGHLTIELGRRPTGPEVRRAAIRRVRRAVSGARERAGRKRS